MKALLSDPEGRFPISIIDDGGYATALTLKDAERLRDALAEAIAEICQYFRCTDESGTKSVPGFRCHARGSVKQPDGTYLCKHHAKRVAK